MTTALRENHLIQCLRAFGLDPDDFVVFGSAPLLAHGLREEVSDLDVVVRGGLWHRLSRHGAPASGNITGDPVRSFCGGRIQFSQRWISAEWDTDDLIARADVIDGIRFAPLADVLAYKRSLNRSKDRADIAALTDHFGRDGGVV